MENKNIDRFSYIDSLEWKNRNAGISIEPEKLSGRFVLIYLSSFNLGNYTVISGVTRKFGNVRQFSKISIHKRVSGKTYIFFKY